MEQDYLNDPEFQELIRQYVQYLSDNLPEVKRNLTEKDYLKIQKFGHNLKGSGGGYGLNEISAIGQKIEETAKLQDYEKIKELIDEFDQLLQTAVDKWLN
ncbi:MAG: Hpt domain-containing protein [Candidatus Neomarinimicrobiota bacterium]